MDKPKPAATGGPVAPPRPRGAPPAAAPAAPAAPAAAPAAAPKTASSLVATADAAAAAAAAAAAPAPVLDEKDPAYKRSHFGLWCLDLFENMVAPAREAASIERFDQLGSTYVKHVAGQFSLTFAAFPIGTDEKLIVEGLDRRVFAVEDLLLFFKTSEGFLDPKEELKVVRKRYAALFVLLKASLRFARSALVGFTIDSKVPPEALRTFTLLMREDPLPVPAEDLKRLQAELKRRDIRGITLIPQTDLLTQGVMNAGCRVLLTVMKRGIAAVTDKRELEVYANSYARVGGPAITSDLITNVEHVLPPDQRELVKAHIIGGMSVPELLAWRDALEKMGEELAAASLKESDPGRRASIEQKLKALPALLKVVVAKIPDTELQKEAAVRATKFTAQQDAKQEYETMRRAKEAAAALEADSQAFIAKLDGLKDKEQYPREVKQSVDAFMRLIGQNVGIATTLMQVLFKHRTDASLPWRQSLATSALKDLGSERMLNKFFELLKSTKTEEQELARLALAGVGEPAVGMLWAALSTAEEPRLFITILKDSGEPAESFVAGMLQASAASLSPPLLRAGLEILGHGKRAERFDLVAGFVKGTDSGVRELAFKSIVALDPVKAQPLVKRYVGDKDVVVASMCLLMMGEMKTNDPHVVRQMIETIKPRLKDQNEADDRLQIASAKALAKLGNFKFGDATLEDVFISLVKPKEKKLFGGDKFKEKSEPVRAAVCEAMGLIGNEPSVQVLRVLAMEEAGVGAKLVGNVDLQVRNAAREALRAIGVRSKPR